MPSPAGESAGTGKLNATVGALKFGFYGTLLLNISAADSGVIGEDVPLWALPGNGNVTFPTAPRPHPRSLHHGAANRARGCIRTGAPPAVGRHRQWSNSTFLDQHRPADANLPQGRVFDQPRLRVAYFNSPREHGRFVAGQDKVIIAPSIPSRSARCRYVPLGATAGLWGWLPQVRNRKTQNLTDKTTALLQFGVLRRRFADPRLGDTVPVGTSLDNSTAGARSTMPFFETRAAISHPMHGSTATVGIGATTGVGMVGVNHKIDSWSTAIDLKGSAALLLDLSRRRLCRQQPYSLQGESIAAWQQYTAATAPFKTIKKIDSGSWGELTIRATSDDKNHFYVGAGLDDPVHPAALPVRPFRL